MKIKVTFFLSNQDLWKQSFFHFFIIKLKKIIWRNDFIGLFVFLLKKKLIYEERKNIAYICKYLFYS